MDQQPKSVRTSIFFYVPLAIAGIALVAYVFIHNYREGEQAGLNAPPPAEGTRTAAGEQVNHRALAMDTGLRGKGRTLFQINCASCHGPAGQGDGDRAGSLNPPPRNFHQEQFKFGDDILSLRNTILRGSPGTSMPSFQLLPAEDVWALAHYVHSQVPNPPPITEELVAELPETGGAGGSAGEGTQAGGAAGVADTAAAGSGERIPIKFAMERMLATHRPRAETPPATVNPSHPGAAIYAQRCAGCHGADGQGTATRVVNVAPYSYVYTGSLGTDPNDKWISNRNEFAKIVVKGMPGQMMPGFATLTKVQIDNLYDYVRTLRAGGVSPVHRVTP